MIIKINKEETEEEDMIDFIQDVFEILTNMNQCLQRRIDYLGEDIKNREKYRQDTFDVEKELNEKNIEVKQILHLLNNFDSSLRANGVVFDIEE